MTQIERLLDLMHTLRSENGCPWDREQTLKTLRAYAVEEVYEVIDAIDREDVDDHCEELGDLLLQVVFHAQLRKEAGEFEFDDVARSISDKLVRRHPHVFGDLDVNDSEEVLRNWEAIKQEEKKGQMPSSSRLDKVPHHLPALLKSNDLQKIAAKSGFDWPAVDDVLVKMEEEIGELREALALQDQGKIGEELGDLLFVLANVGRHVGVDPEQALQDACLKFRRRFAVVEKGAETAGRALEDHSLEEMDGFWNQAKDAERHEG